MLNFKFAVSEKKAMKNRIAMLAIVGTIAAFPPTGVLAQGRSPAKSPVQSAPADALRAADEALVEARRAFVRNDPARFEAAARRAAGHPLAEYLDFWRLRMRLQESSGDPGTLAGGLDPLVSDRDIRRFLVRHRDTVVADLMRRDWMLDLAKRRQWEAFDAQYADWVLRDDDQVHCYRWLGRVERGLPADGALAALNAVRDLDEACGNLLVAMHQARLVDRGQIFARLLAGIETNSRDAVDRTAGLLGLDPAAIATAWSRPPKALSLGPEREVALIALARWARTDPQAAAARLEAGFDPLPAADQAFAWSQVAAAGMRRLAPESFAWTLRGMQAQVTDETRVWMARAALREQHWPTLRAIIEQMSDENRRDPVWAYWHGRALVAAGETAAGHAQFRSVAGGFHFYGQLAAEELGELVRTPPRATMASDAEIAEAARNPGFGRALKFYEIGLRLEGNREWNYQLRGMSDRQLLAAARWACKLGVLDRCVNTADRTVGEHDFSLRFVKPFYDELKPVAAGRDLDPAWIYGLIRQESRFVMDARSSAGAQGLMQIMPATGRWIARKLGVRNFRAAQLNELPVNLEFGTFYLKTVLDDLDGSPVLASAAYNAGPGRPRNWRTTLPTTVEGAIFAEIIPFSETRDYVKKVLSNAVIYAEMFTGEPQSLKTKLGSVMPGTPAGTIIP